MNFSGGLRILLTLILVLLVGNTWLSLSVQARLAEKSVELEQLLRESTGKSEKVNEQLDQIRNMEEKTAALSRKITTLLDQTRNMEREWKRLDSVVSSINQTVSRVGDQTAGTVRELEQIRNLLGDRLNRLASMRDAHRKVESTLGNMKSIQGNINSELKSINRKTDWIPEKGGSTQ
ncbi:hypothetical protein [Staphylospora marina]|uniref:hypothetical protein n=1 Tax=Staphylospora marina TaxID=2490858 RepID=UPI000F5BF1A0|nr:hypothetical protein [Staphylospora marina]